MVCIRHWGQFECRLKVIAREFLRFGGCVIIWQASDHSGHLLVSMEIVSGFEHNVLYGRLNLVVENRFAIGCD